ncbi:MAG: diguanylate cyclase [Nostocales cyanobacterium 94392]|nr:diguanylate cyclase [Nostocales cyanobacterium 94392]
MCIEEILEFIEITIYNNAGRKLTAIEKEILKAALQKEAYTSIAGNCHLSLGHIKDVAYKLWNELSQILGEKVTKSNLRLVLAKKTSLSVMNTLTQADSEIVSYEDIESKNNYILQLQQEIQGLKQTQGILYKSHTFLESLLNISFDGIAVIQVLKDSNTEKIIDFKFLIANYVISKLFYNSYENLVGNLLLQNKIIQDNPSLFNFLVKVVETQQPLYQELQINIIDDIQNWYKITAVSLGDEIILTVRNITQLKLLEMELVRQVSIEALTNIKNRDRFDEYLSQEWQRSEQKKQAISLILCQINNLKFDQNSDADTKNHELLIRISLIFNNSIKNTTFFVGHYTENQFAVVLVHTDLDRVFSIAQLIQSEFEKLNMPHALQFNQNLSMSVGIANMIPTKQLGAEALIIAAEAMLSGNWV